MIKSFKEFLNEFELEGDYYENKRYNGDHGQIMYNFEADMESQFGSIRIIDGEEDTEDYWRHSEFGKNPGTIFCAYYIDNNNNTLEISISCDPDKKGLTDTKTKLKNIKLDKFITEIVLDGEVPNQFNRVSLTIPVGLIK